MFNIILLASCNQGCHFKARSLCRPTMAVILIGTHDSKPGVMKVDKQAMPIYFTKFILIIVMYCFIKNSRHIHVYCYVYYALHCLTGWGGDEHVHVFGKMGILVSIGQMCCFHASTLRIYCWLCLSYIKFIIWD